MNLPEQFPREVEPQEPEGYSDKLAKLTALLLRGETFECPVTHHFGEGVYIREMFIPAGTVVVGKHHRHESVNLLMQGTITVLTPEGKPKTLKAPQILFAPPGAKCVYAHTDVIWANVHHTTETDLAVIEKIFIDETKNVQLLEEAHKLLKAIEAQEVV